MKQEKFTSKVDKLNKMAVGELFTDSAKLNKINEIPVGELFTDSSKVKKLNQIDVGKLIENFEGGIQKRRLKVVFVVLVLLALWLVLFY
jgi:hypothetical protein